MLLGFSAPGPSTQHPLRQCVNSGRLAGRKKLRGEGLQAVSQHAPARAGRRPSAAPRSPPLTRPGLCVQAARSSSRWWRSFEPEERPQEPEEVRRAAERGRKVPGGRGRGSKRSGAAGSGPQSGKSVVQAQRAAHLHARLCRCAPPPWRPYSPSIPPPNTPFLPAPQIITTGHHHPGGRRHHDAHPQPAAPHGPAGAVAPAPRPAAAAHGRGAGALPGRPVHGHRHKRERRLAAHEYLWLLPGAAWARCVRWACCVRFVRSAATARRAGQGGAGQAGDAGECELSGRRGGQAHC